MLVSIQDISKYYGEKLVLQHVTADLEENGLATVDEAGGWQRGRAFVASRLLLCSCRRLHRIPVAAHRLLGTGHTV